MELTLTMSLLLPPLLLPPQAASMSELAKARIMAIGLRMIGLLFFNGAGSFHDLGKARA